MISLEDYISQINEAKSYYSTKKTLWTRIKDWFKDIFSWSDDRDYDDDDYYELFSNDSKAKNVKNARKLKGEEKEEYEEIVKTKFKGKDCKIVRVDDEKMFNGIIKPKGAEPDEKSNTGFWKFLDQAFSTNDPNQKLFHYAVSWVGTEGKKKDAKTEAFLDYPALITMYRRGYNVNIINMQILKEYDNILSYRDLIGLIEQNVPSLFRNAKYIQFFERYDKDTYQKLVNDCGFETEFSEKAKSNVAYIKISKI